MTSSKKATAHELTQFYADVLNSLGMQVDDKGLVSLIVVDKKLPAMISNKRMVVPYAPVLKNPDWNNQIAFHPLAENFYRGESSIIKKLKKLINFRLSSVTMTLMVELAILAADSDNHDKLTPHQKELLEVLPKATQKTVDAIEKVVGTISPKPGGNRLINIYLKHGGEFNGHKYARTAVTRFPVLDAIDVDNKTVFDVDMKSKKDAKAFEDLLGYIIPDCDVKDAYSHGSSSMEVPYFDALINAYVKVAKRLNAVTWLFRKHLDDYKSLFIDVNEFEDKLNSLSDYQDLIPSLEGNAGNHGVATRGEAEEAEPAKPAAKPKANNKSAFARMAQDVNDDATQAPDDDTPPFTPDPKPTANATPAEGSGGRVSWAEIQQRRQQNMQPQQPMQQPAMMGYQQPAGRFQAPGAMPQQPQAQLWNQPAPPGFGGAPFTPGQPQQMGGAYANHPRHNPNMGWGQPQPQPMGMANPVYPGGL